MKLFVPQEVENVFEAHDMSVVTIGEQGCKVYFELEAYTNAGEDMVHTLWLDKGSVADVRAWWKEFNEMHENFDPYEHAAGWIGHLDETPFSCNAELFEDAIDYDNKLKVIEQELFNLVFKPEPRKKKFLVDVTMLVPFSFYMEAEDMDEAKEKAYKAMQSHGFFEYIKDDIDFKSELVEETMFSTMGWAQIQEDNDPDIDPIDVDWFIND